jgi:hypothetical protein
VVGGANRFVDLLLKTAVDAKSDGVAFVSQCLLLGRRKCSAKDFKVAVSPDQLKYCPESLVLALPDEAFFTVAAALVRTHSALDSSTFKIVAEGLRRLFHDTRNLTVSTTTMLGHLEVLVQVDRVVDIHRSHNITNAQSAFLKALCATPTIWTAETTLWNAYGLAGGRDSVRQMIDELHDRSVVLSRIAALIAYRANIARPVVAGDDDGLGGKTIAPVA